MRRILVVLAACALSLACAAPAHADMLALLAAVGEDFTQDGKLNPCKYTEKQLRDLRNAIPNDYEQYSDFTSVIDDALAKRARGACKKGGAPAQDDATAPPATGATTPPPAAGSPSTGTAPSTVTPGPAAAQPPPRPATAPTAAPAIATRDAIGLAARSTEPATEAPFPLLALALLTALLALGTLMFGVVRWRAWEPAWANRFRHAAGEAGWRASSTWADFTDFVRFGR